MKSAWFHLFCTVTFMACDVDDAASLDDPLDAVAEVDDVDGAGTPGAANDDASPLYTAIEEEDAVEDASFDLTDLADPALDGGTCCFQCGSQLYKNYIPGACLKYAKWVCDVKNKPFKGANWC
ncbi:MAG: hypothetical protein JNL82_22850 [Myxococcales bacterium]|nr:hypothetical protein [Myxococcales bacterium]